MIRVDGFWRTAADLYSRQFGLLETETGQREAKKRPADDAAATTTRTS